MIDVYATAATFSDPRKLAQALASALMSIERVTTPASCPGSIPRCLDLMPECRSVPLSSARDRHRAGRPRG
jgi:hypothetical protein